MQPEIAGWKDTCDALHIACAEHAKTIDQFKRQLLAASKDTEFYCDQAHKLRSELAAANNLIAKIDNANQN